MTCHMLLSFVVLFLLQKKKKTCPPLNLLNVRPLLPGLLENPSVSLFSFCERVFGGEGEGIWW